jgi:hypothetical protein
MPRPNFSDSLRVPTPPRGTTGPPPGPLAQGPVPDGDELTWMQVWIFQNYGRARTAIAWGTSKYDAPRQAERPPFRGSWRVPTELERNSDPFSPGKPALATAIALVKHDDGTKEVDWWSEAVTIAAPRRRSR